MIYGYSRDQLSEDDQPLELTEITLAMGATELRLLGKFLLEMAAAMEAGEFERCSHRHMTSTYPEWSDLHPSADVIVMP